MLHMHAKPALIHLRAMKYLRAAYSDHVVKIFDAIIGTKVEQSSFETRDQRAARKYVMAYNLWLTSGPKFYP